MRTLILILTIAMAGNVLVAQEPFPNLEKIRPTDAVERIKAEIEEVQPPKEMRSILEKSPTPALAKPKVVDPYLIPVAKPTEVSKDDEIDILKAEILSLEKRLSELEKLVGKKPVEAPVLTFRSPAVIYVPAQFPESNIYLRSPEKPLSSGNLFRRYGVR